MTTAVEQLNQVSPMPHGKTPAVEQISIRLEFGSQPKHQVSLPKRISQDESEAGDDKPVTVKYLIKWMKDNLLSERVEMFGDGDGVRPGILVLINDTDWELEGELDYQLQENDEVVFISTLHGG
ncbi:hypothetical protein QFC21_002686 [Naganishia friedmannii]|uniref:Uncharacterized protein n=1 Tax=Naganishia friedmannii TaxID=89922 RepID=A0ACC2VVV2_9TREE|nr:hypothetical protein QFC21_002686 [Naganishia friedmannii]